MLLPPLSRASSLYPYTKYPSILQMTEFVTFFFSCSTAWRSSPLDCKEIQPVHPKGNQSWIFIGRTDQHQSFQQAETPVLWLPDAKSWLIWKDPDAGRDWGPEEKGMTENEMVGWHDRLNGHEFEQALGVGDGQGGLACCSPWGRKESDMTEWLNWTELNIPSCIRTTTSLSIHLSMDM